MVRWRWSVVSRARLDHVWTGLQCTFEASEEQDRVKLSCVYDGKNEEKGRQLCDIFIKELNHNVSSSRGVIILNHSWSRT
jgi:hypothetical protein